MRRFEKRDSGCWEWSGATGCNGYCRIYCHERRRLVVAHRVSWEIHRGPIPEGMLVCHRCDNRKCVNPDHLFLGTYQDNYQDMVDKGRRTWKPWTAGVKWAAKVNPQKVRQIRQLASMGVHPKKLSEMFGVCAVNIRLIIRRKTWADVE